MIQINSETNQKDLIQQLFSALSDEGSIYIELNSLPYFLSSIPSIKVFQYKIQNYPKPIFWFSNNESILEFLATTSLPIDFPPTLTSEDKIEDKIQSIVAQNVIKTTTPNPQIKESELPVMTKLEQLRLKVKKEEKIDFKQDLNSWLEKIESTKESLSRFQEEAHQQYKNQQKNKITTLLSDLSSSVMTNKWFKFSLASFVLLGIGLVCVSLYPTNVIKLEVAPVQKQDSLNITFADTNLDKNIITLSVEAELDTTGTKDIQSSTGRSMGKVSLINNSNGSLDFTRDGLILISEANSLEYRQKSSQTDPKMYSVAGKNIQNNLPIEIEIQASEKGDNYNLPKDSGFRVYNLRGENMGSSFKAMSLTDIKNTQTSPEKYVSEADLSLLRSKAETLLSEEQSKQIEALKSKSKITSNNWTKIIKTDYKISAKVGDSLSKITCIASSEIEIYSLSEDSLKNSIQNKTKVSSINDIKLASENIKDGQVSADVFFSYKENPEIFKSDIYSRVGSFATDQNTLDIQSQYPNIKRVSKDFQGVNLPLLQPRSKIEINELQIK